MEAIIGLIIRHVLTSAGAALVTHGVLTAATVEPFVGAGVTLFGVVLSVIQKYRAGLVGKS